MISLWSLSFPLWHYILRASVTYLFVLLLLRLSGKRQIGQMGAAEFVALLLISNAVQNAMNGGDNSVTSGLILASVLIALSAAIAYFSYRSKSFEVFIQGRPRLLIFRGEVVTENLEREFLNVRELKTMLRRQGLEHFHEIQEAILENNGSISVIKKSEGQNTSSNKSSSLGLD